MSENIIGVINISLKLFVLQLLKQEQATLTRFGFYLICQSCLKKVKVTYRPLNIPINKISIKISRLNGIAIFFIITVR